METKMHSVEAITISEEIKIFLKVTPTISKAIKIQSQAMTTAFKATTI